MLLCGVATVGVMAVGGVAWSAVHAVGTTARLPAAHPADATARSAEATSSVVQTVASASRIEVPDLVGMDLD